MRPLAYAALLVALAGCSLPYQGTSFAALPELQAKLHGEGKKAEGDAGEKSVASADRMYTPDADDASVQADADRDNRVGVVFPPTAQPQSGAVATEHASGASASPSPKAPIESAPSGTNPAPAGTVMGSEGSSVEKAAPGG